MKKSAASGRAIRLAALAACLAWALVGTACSATQRHVPAQQALAQIGLPVYPGAEPIGAASEQSARSVVGSTDTLTVVMTTRDSFDRVKRFYEDALPKGKREVVVPMGKFSNCTMQFFEKNAQKQVTLLTLNGMTVIDLGSTALGPLVPTPAASR